MEAYYKMNKIRRFAGKLRTCIRLKCKIKPTHTQKKIKTKQIKNNFFFNQSENFHPNSFGARSFPDRVEKKKRRHP